MALPFADVAHLLRRSGFVARYDRVVALQPLSWADAVEQVLDSSVALPASPPAVPKTRDSWQNYVDMVHFWADRAATSPAPIAEKMALFWHGLLPTSLDKVFHHRQVMDQNMLFRTSGLGSIYDLYQTMAVQPAMLHYLDNAQNVKRAPNENFARELMELFLLGIGNYSEDDVRASALAWTGHITSEDDEHYVYDPSQHHSDPTTFMGVTQVWDGPQIIDHLINGPKRDQVSRFLSTKLWSFLAYPNPSAAVVDSIAASMRSGGMRVDATLRAIFNHPEFRGAQAKQGLVRSPFEYMVAAMAHTGIGADVAHPEWFGQDMGQAVFYPPNVAGWRSNGYWISSSAAWSKHRFASNLRWNLDKGELFKDLAAMAPRQAAEQALAQFGIHQPAPSTLASIEQFVSAERSANGWGERAGLLFLPMLTPDFQLA